MPKDAKKNVDRYKVRGGDLNEFEFHQNQAQAAKKAMKPTKGAPAKGAPAKAPAKATAKGATAKKLAAKKAGKK